MTIQEDAERLRSIASSDDLPIGLLRQADTQLDTVQAQVLTVLDGQSQHGSNIHGLIGAAKEAIANAMAATMAVESAIHDAADYHGRG